MSITVSCTHSDFDGEILVEGHYEAGSPGRLWGPPENCYPPEPSFFEIHKVFIGGAEVLLLLREEVISALEEQAFEKCAASPTTRRVARLIAESMRCE